MPNSERLRNGFVARIVAALFSGTLLLAALPVAAGEHPNVLLVLTDDQGFGDIASHGNPIVQTPNMDRLAADGVRVDRFFVSPVCAPTRASLLTGRYHLRTGVSGVTRGYENLRPQEWTMAEMFREAGYATGAFGKWHNGRHMPYHPNGQGFDTFVGFCGGHWNTYFNPTLEHNGRPLKTRGYINDVVTDHAIRFIREHRERPFFCYVPFNTPHSPWRAPQPIWEQYEGKQLDTKAQAAYAMVQSIDENLGRLLETLEQLQLSQQTIVLFLTDNGANSPRFNAGMRGRKGSVDEGGMRVPLFIRFPGQLEAGAVVRRNVFHLDVLPTLADLCGIDVSQDRSRLIDGVSVARLLQGNTPNDWPNRVFYSVRYRVDSSPPDERVGIRDDRWRATRNKGRWRLYDMQTDPGQEQDVAAEHPDELRRLIAGYSGWLEDVTRDGLEPPPIPLGHPARDHVELPPCEATLHPGYGEGIFWTGDTPNGFANCWIDRWTSDEAYVQWPVQFLTPGRYAFTAEYTLARQDVGCQLQLHVGSQQLVKNVGRAFTAPLEPKPDRLYSSNYQEKAAWAELPLGVLRIEEPGKQIIQLRTTIARNKSVDLRRIRVRRLGD